MGNLSFNPSARVRSAIYVLTAVANPVIAYLGQENVIASFWVGLWLVLNGAILGLARLNVTPEEK